MQKRAAIFAHVVYANPSLMVKKYRLPYTPHIYVLAIYGESLKYLLFVTRHHVHYRVQYFNTHGITVILILIVRVCHLGKSLVWKTVLITWQYSYSGGN